MIIKHNILFRLYPYAGREKFQVRIRVSWNGNRYETGTGIILLREEDFDKERGEVSREAEKVDDISKANRRLLKCRDTMATVFKYFELNDVLPSVNMISDEYSRRMNPQEKDGRPQITADVLTVLDWFVRENTKRNGWSRTTVFKFNRIRKDIEEFDPYVTFADLTSRWLTSYTLWLQNGVNRNKARTKRSKEGPDLRTEDDFRGLENSTVKKRILYLRWFLTWATENGYNTNMDFKKYSPPLKKADPQVIYLTKEELKAIKDLSFSWKDRNLEVIRDAFVFSCFSGLRFSDVCNLRKTDVRDDYFEVVTIKTGARVRVELNETTTAILKKYEKTSIRDDRALPTFTNQAHNRGIKEVCRMAGVNEKVHVTGYRANRRYDEVHEKWELVGTHTGRRTFIVMALSMGIPPNVVMKWTGHGDYKAMQPYIDIVDEIKSRAMSKFDSLLEE